MARTSALGIALAAGLLWLGLRPPAASAQPAAMPSCEEQRQSTARLMASARGQQALEVAAAKAALAKLDDLRSRFQAGETLEEPYAGASHWQKLSRGAAEPVKAELFRRVAKDQFARSLVIATASRTSWAAGLSDAAVGIASAAAFTRDWCGIDEDNTRWLQQQIRTRGWFRRKADGRDADNAAFLLVQHADGNKAFQKEVLRMLEPLLKAGDVRPQNYALLFDRVAVGEKRPQRYGSQGNCTGPGTWAEFAVEAPASLDQRRAQMSLEPMAAYRKRFKAACGGG